MEKIIQLASIFNLASFSWDILMLLFLFTASFLYGMTMGKNRMTLVILSTYMSFAIFSSFPFSYFSYFENLSSGNNLFFLKLGVFLLFFALTFVILNRSFFGHLFRVSKALYNISFFKILLLSFAQVGLFMSIFFSIMLSEKMSEFTGLTSLIFANEIAQVVWFLIPLVFLGLFKNRKQAYSD